jgi:branched-chain amino acid transport system substrate-binding protein
MKRSVAALALIAGLVSAAGALAQGKLDKVVKVGSLGDQSGLYQDIGGPGSNVAAQMAIEDSGLLAKGWKIDLISADHQNKPDVGTNIGTQCRQPELGLGLLRSHGPPMFAEHGALGL